MKQSLWQAAVCVAALGGPAVAQDAEPVKAGDFRVLSVDRTFNYKRGSAVGTVEFRRDGTLIYRARGGSGANDDLDGAWDFSGNRLCMRIATLNEGQPECSELTALGPDDYELEATGVHIFR